MSPSTNLLIIQIATVAGAGLFGGVAAAAIGLLAARGVEAVAVLVSTLYYALSVVLPGAVWLAHSNTLTDPAGRAAYRLRRTSATFAVLTGAIGSILGAGPFFLVAGVNLPIVLGGYDATAFSAAVTSRVFWPPYLIVCTVTIATALLSGGWAHQRASHSA